MGLGDVSSETNSAAAVAGVPGADISSGDEPMEKRLHNRAGEQSRSLLASANIPLRRELERREQRSLAAIFPSESTCPGDFSRLDCPS